MYLREERIPPSLSVFAIIMTPLIHFPHLPYIRVGATLNIMVTKDFLTFKFQQISRVVSSAHLMALCSELRIGEGVCHPLSSHETDLYTKFMDAKFHILLLFLLLINIRFR